MTGRRMGAVVAVGLMLATAPAAAQSGGGALGGLAGLGGAGGLSGLMPGLGGASAGNVAGLLSYCVKNRLVGDAGKSALGGLLGRKDVTASPGFVAGQSGTVMPGQGAGFSLDSLKGQVKTKVCDMVLQRAGSFLPR